MILDSIYFRRRTVSAQWNYNFFLQTKKKGQTKNFFFHLSTKISMDNKQFEYNILYNKSTSLIYLSIANDFP